jgi:hypothetical protein
MRMLTLIAIFTLPLHASASPACMGRVQAAYLKCHEDCGSLEEAARIDCIRGCNVAYSIGKRECQRDKFALITEANWNSDGGCKQMTSNHDSRIRFLCMADGVVYETYGQCRTYCR